MLSSPLFTKQCGKFSQPADINAFVELAFITAVGSVGFEDIAVADFEFLQNAAFVDDTWTAVVGEAG